MLDCASTFAQIGRQIEDADDWLRDNSVQKSERTYENYKLNTYPTKPLPIPLKKPFAPSDSAPSMGFTYEELALGKRL